MLGSKRMETCKNGLGYSTSNTFYFAPFHLWPDCPSCSFSSVQQVTNSQNLLLSVLSSCHYLSLCHLEELHHLQDVYLIAKVGAGQWIKIKKIWGVHSATETKKKIRWSWSKSGYKKSLCGGNILDLYQHWCPSRQTFFQKADITDLIDEKHKAPFQLLPRYFFNIEVWVYLETSSRATRYIEAGISRGC